MQGNGRETGRIRHKLGSLFSPRGPPSASRGKEEVDHGTFITADVLRVRGRGLGVDNIVDIHMYVHVFRRSWRQVSLHSAGYAP